MVIEGREGFHPLRPASQETPSLAAPPDDFSARVAWIAVSLWMMLAVILLARHLAYWQIPTRDACAYYLPMAKAVADGDGVGSHHAIIPPLYPMMVGYLSRALPGADDPQELAGKVIGLVSVLLLVACVYALGHQAASRRVGVMAAGLTAVNPWVIRYGTGIGPEIPYGVLITLGVVAMMRYYHRPGWAAAAAMALLGGLVSLTRSEGIFLPPLMLGAMAVICLTTRQGGWRRLGLHIVVFATVLLAVWSPRLAYMRNATGWYVLDARMLILMPVGRQEYGAGVNSQWWRPTNTVNLVLMGQGRPLRDWAETAKETMESVGMTITPVTWALAALCLLPPRGRPRHGVAQALAVVVILGQLLVVGVVQMHRRYVVPIAGLAQLWAALGLVVLDAHLERVRRRLDPLGQRLCRSWTVLAVLCAGLAVWSLLPTRRGVDDAYLKPMGQSLERQLGPGKVYVTSSSEIPYYARGKRVLVVHLPPSPPASWEFLRDRICRLPGGTDQWADFILIHPEETWCPYLLEEIRAGRLPPGALLPFGPFEQTGWRLIDVRKLFAQPVKGG